MGAARTAPTLAVAEAGVDVFGRVQQETVNGQAVVSAYDGAGRVTTRTIGTGATQRQQVLSWDARSRLVQVKEFKGTACVSLWRAYYDARDRRIRTEYIPVNGTTEGPAQLLDSTYDPQVEFLEIALAARSTPTTAIPTGNVTERVWKVYGPDLSGVYGGAQGVGGLEALLDEKTGAATGIINDLFGHAAFRIPGGINTAPVTQARVSSYGPFATTDAVTGSSSTPLATIAMGTRSIETGPNGTASLLIRLGQATAYQGRRIDPTGFYNFGARYYEPETSRFLSADPLGYGSSLSRYDYANGNPVNQLDPDGLAAEFIGYVYEAVNAELGNYVGSTVSLQGRFLPSHKQWDLLQNPKTNIKMTPVYGTLPPGETAWTQSSLNHALRAPEERGILKLEAEGKTLRNTDRAAKPENLAEWEARYKVTTGEPMEAMGAGEALAGKAAAQRGPKISRIPRLANGLARGGEVLFWIEMGLSAKSILDTAAQAKEMNTTSREIYEARLLSQVILRLYALPEKTEGANIGRDIVVGIVQDRNGDLVPYTDTVSFLRAGSNGYARKWQVEWGIGEVREVSERDTPGARNLLQQNRIQAKANCR